jgi:hypothetical protein
LALSHRAGLIFVKGQPGGMSDHDACQPESDQGDGMKHSSDTINSPRNAPSTPHPGDRFDHWAGRVIDVLAGVGLLAVLSALSGYIWGLLH